MPEAYQPDPPAPGSRRDRFRRYMRAFNPTQAAQEAIQAGLVREDLHGGIYRQIAARAELQPGSRQLLIGGIGSGKTTELLLAEAQMRAEGMHPFYIDIPAETDLYQLKAGALVASFGERLLKMLPGDEARDLQKPVAAVREFARGRIVFVPDDQEEPPGDDEPGTWQVIPGKLRPPNPPLHSDIARVTGAIQAIRIRLNPDLNFVVICDGLDRLIKPDLLWQVANQDLQVFRDLEIPIVLAAPLTLLFGREGRAVYDQFDPVHTMFDLVLEGGGSDRMRDLISCRDQDHMLSPQVAEAICQFSGGALRDLLTLARDAGEHAYMSGAADVSSHDVEVVAKRLGHSYLRGLGPDELRLLERIERTGSFRTDDPAYTELLATRRVLEYSETQFAVHPALKLVLEPVANA